jgi:hypothetical protein
MHVQVAYVPYGDKCSQGSFTDEYTLMAGTGCQRSHDPLRRAVVTCAPAVERSRMTITNDVNPVPCMARGSVFARNSLLRQATDQSRPRRDNALVLCTAQIRYGCR